MELNANKTTNKENNNPVLVPSQFELLSKEGIFSKTSNSIHSQHRFYYRKPRQSITQTSQPQAPIQVIGHSSSSCSIQKEIEKIAKQLQSQQMQTCTQVNFQIPLKERYPTQYNNQQTNEVVGILQKENLLRIQQIKPCTPRRPFTPQINYNLPPLLCDNKSNDQEISEKQTPHLRRNFQNFKKNFAPSTGDFKKITQLIENRQKRTTSQILQPQILNKQPNVTIKERIEKCLNNSHKILIMCNNIPEISNIISNEQIVDLIQSDHFKIELQHLINNSQGSFSEMEAQLQNFMIEQVKKRKELLDAEHSLREKKQNFCSFLNNYIVELRSKL